MGPTTGASGARRPACARSGFELPGVRPPTQPPPPVAPAGVGRVLADAHWMSDTLAASFCSIALVSAMAMVVRPVCQRLAAREATTGGKEAGL